MVSEFYGLNRGDLDQPETVQVGTSTNSTDIEVRIDLTKNLTRLDTEMLLDAIMRRILDSGSGELGQV